MKKITRRTFLRAAGCMAAAAGLSACGAASTASSAAASGAVASGAAADAETVEIEYLNHKSETEAIDAMDKIIAAFEEENPGIKVTQTTTSDFSTVISTRAETGDMPDVFSCSTSTTYELMFDEGLIMDLTGQEFLGQVAADTLALSTHNDKNWRLPYALSAYGLFVRTDILEQNGIEVPTTYAELMDACEKLQAAGVTPFCCPDQDSGCVGQRMERLMGVISKGSDDEFQQIVAGDLNPEDSVTLTAFAKAQHEIANYTTADSLGVDHESAYQNFANGEGAFMIDGTWALATLKSYVADIQTVLVPFPNPTGDETLVPVSIDTSFCISEGTAHADACLKFLEYLSRTDAAQAYCDNEGSPNVITGVKYGVEEYSAIVDSMNAGKIFVSLNAIWPSGLRNAMRDYASELILNKDEAAFVSEAAALLPEYYTA